MTAPPARRPGRRPGPSSSREDILAAARVLFGERGYDKASIRAIAREAKVDPALVHHYFGSKEELFAAAMEFPIDPNLILAQFAGPREDVGERIVRMFLRVWGDPELGPQFVGVMRSATTTEQGAALLREFVSARLLARVSATAGVPKLNLNLAASQMVGVAMLRYVLKVEPIASAAEDDLVTLLAPMIQRYLTPDAPEP
jgi:AcrR family transcriptional regulator